MTSEVLSKLWKYKKQLDAFVKRVEDDKVLIMLQKINKLNVTIEMIKETSIGKLVNSITSKEELGIGEKASNLVLKWKRLIEEIVDKKYKSDEDVSPQRTMVPVEAPAKKSSPNSKKLETSEKPHLKRKSEVLDDRSKPPKQARTTNKSVTDDRKPEKNVESTSFLDALNHKTSNPDIGSPSGPAQPDSDNDFFPDQDSEKDYSDEVFEHIENILAMFEDRKKALEVKVTSHEPLGGRIYAVPSMFCGKKAVSKKNSPTFLENFQHLLFENIENVEFIGDVPYEILEPVLKKLNPTQLERFEYFNPVVVQRSDELWKRHVLLKYPKRKPDEFGSWREVYLDNRDAMKAKFEQCLQKFTTNVVKMKREEHKTKFFDPCTAKPGKRSTFSRGGVGSNPINSNFRARGSTFPQKSAPLMQKTMKMMNKR